jgi:hypothetical protein
VLIEQSFLLAPELPAVGDLTCFPAQVSRPKYEPRLQQAAALVLVSTFIQAPIPSVYPDRVDRPAMPAREQMAACYPPRAGILFRSGAVSTDSTSFTCNKPPGTVQGEVIVALVESYDDQTQTITPPSAAWKLWKRWDPAAFPFSTQVVYTLVAGASEPSSYTWTTSFAGPLFTDIILLTYAGVDTVTPVDLDISNDAAANSATASAPSITLTTNNERLVFFFVPNVHNMSVPTDMREITPGINVDHTQAFEQPLFVQGATGTRSGTLTSDAWATVMFALLPEGTFQPPPSVFADAIARKSFQAHHQLAVTELSPQPERTSTLWSEWQDDRVWRPTFPAHQQMAASELPPQPELTIALAWQPVFPERAPRRMMPASEHPFLAFDPKPEQTIALAWQAIFPERIARPQVPTAQQPSFAFYPLPIVAAPTITYVVFPDGVVRPYFQASRQQAFAMASQPERTSPIESEHHVDRPWRPAFPAHQQLAVTELSPNPEQTIALAWQPWFPERVARPGVPAAQQPSFAFYAFPLPGAPPFSYVIYPDGVVRPRYPIAEQQAFASNVQPERTSPIAVEVHPDRPWRPSFGVWQQLASTELSPQPERTSPLAVEVHPDRPWRPSFATHQQLAVTELSPKPERTSPLAVEVHPDRPTRPVYPPHLQQFLAFDPKPERTSPLAVEVHPDRPNRPAYAPHQHAFTTWLPPTPIVTAPLAWAPVYPEQVRRPIYPAARQQAFAFWPFPIPPISAPYLRLVITNSLPFGEFQGKLPPQPSIFPERWRAVQPPLLLGLLEIGMADQQLRVRVDEVALGLAADDDDLMASDEADGALEISVEDDKLTLKGTKN